MLIEKGDIENIPYQPDNTISVNIQVNNLFQIEFETPPILDSPQLFHIMKKLVNDIIPRNTTNTNQPKTVKISFIVLIQNVV